MTMMLTPYGRLVRQLRIEGDILTVEMAKALKVSASYLSALETGRKNLTDSFVERVAEFFEKKGLGTEQLYTAADQSKSVVKIHPANEDHALVASFARRFPEMPEEKKKQLLELLNGD
ncbi:helix-turn-helix domain-containing protein [Thiohalomonas denitrificans]|uniref:helix-turn-helix domain-containing protein n=1 Tax=Thiohalomonas denitrificans TaxID=415747 RepID=UPI0026E93C73|nr:helix-turn-helix transcriptional regulator [Thiohalomonas denitrificans]